MRRTLLIGSAILALVIGAACREQEEAEPRAPADLGAELQGLAERLSAILHVRKEIRDTPFYKGTEVLDEIDSLSIRLDACVVNVRRLAAYDEEADKQELAESDRLRFKEADLRSLREHIDHYESAFGKFDIWRDRDGEIFFANYGKVLYANQVLNELIAAEIPTFDEQAIMRDLSQRMLDARRYWCQELANTLRGLEPDQDVLALALGTARALAREIGPVHERLKIASAGFHRLSNGRKGLRERLAWSRAALTAEAVEADFRARAEAALDAIAPEIEDLDRRAAAELETLLDPDPRAYERHDALVGEQRALLERLNAIVLIEAQKRGWPLPR